jgi:phospholipid/cholesterol/gamma-HCH transport system substrate-binding protein
MGRKLSYFQLGLFFLIGLAIILTGLIWIGSHKFWKPTKIYVSYFQESVEGLGPGAEVSYLGVSVGTVISISIAPDPKLVGVMMALDAGFDAAPMAAQMRLRGLSGQFVALDRAPADIDQLTPKLTFKPPYPVIPSRPGEMHQLIAGLKKIYHKVEALDLEGLVESWKNTGQSADALLADKDIPKTIRNLREITAEVNNVARLLSKPGTPKKWRTAFTNLADTINAARQGSESLAAQLEKLPPGSVGTVTRQLEQTMIQVNQVLTNLKGLVHELREEPGKILVVPKEKEPFRR